MSGASHRGRAAWLRTRLTYLIVRTRQVDCGLRTSIAWYAVQTDLVRSQSKSSCFRISFADNTNEIRNMRGRGCAGRTTS